MKNASSQLAFFYSWKRGKFDSGGSVRLQNGQLLVTDRLEAQADQMLMANPPDAHDADKGLNR